MSDFLDDQVTAHARTADHSIAELCRDTIPVPAMTPAGVSDTLANLAAMVAALPQACAQLSRILAQAGVDQVLTMDSLVSGTDPALAIGQAEIHLDDARELAVDLHKLLDAAHQVTAHIVSDAAR